MKQMRRGGMNNGSRGGFQNPNGSGYPPQPPFPGPQMPGFLSMPAGAPPMSFDPNDPMAAMIALQALGMPLPPVPGTGPPGFVPPVAGKTKIDARCRDYDIKGICERGIACPFNHGDDQIFIPPGQQG